MIPRPQRQLLLPDLPQDDALDLIAAELDRHRQSGRKSFLVRASVDQIDYFFRAVLRASGLTKVGLEQKLTDWQIYGFNDADGRTVRRYISGQTQMAWSTYQRMLLWAFNEGWLRAHIFEFLTLQSFYREAAQLAVRAIAEKTRRQKIAITLTQEDLHRAFDEAFRSQEGERLAAAVKRAASDSKFKGDAIELGFEFD